MVGKRGRVAEGGGEGTCSIARAARSLLALKKGGDESASNVYGGRERGRRAI